ncbi:MAG: U32 family peptidase [Planctomycetes bacterium]|nr:U32 family peptidase [Planctomycetota bacterium]
MAARPGQDAAPELLAPAGDWAALRAAAANGADAVYFGLRDFNARLRAANFAAEELPRVIGYLHDRNVKGYVTLNTLVFADELAVAVERLRAIAEAGADAVIVQDLGLVRLARRLAPGLPIHASTQMTLTEARGIELVRGLGVQRVILARELSLADIRHIAAATQVELEVFVHGALCISVSGQCLASLALGGRSANRGLCAQACRLPYQFLADGKAVDTGECRHPLSPQDLAAHERIAELAALGVRGLKIEGRLKGADYVAAAVRAYRAAIDAAVDRRPFRLPPGQEEELALGFSRGFTTGFLDGVDHQSLVVGRSPKGRGLRLGEVVGTTPRGVAVALAPGARVKPGDGVVFDAGGDEEAEEGGRVVAVEPATGQPGRVVLVFRRGDVRLRAVAVGSIVWKTDDPEVRQRLAATYARDAVARPQPVNVRVHAALGEPLRVAFADAAGHEATAIGDRPLELADKHPLTLDVLREQLGRLGGTPFALGALEAERLDPVMAPKSVLNALRRRAVEGLCQQREAAARHPIAEPNALDALRLAPSLSGLIFAHNVASSAPLPAPREAKAVTSSPHSISSSQRNGRTVECGIADAALRPSGAAGEGGRAAPGPALEMWAKTSPLGEGAEVGGISVLVRSLPQLEAVLACRQPSGAAKVGMVYCDLAEPGEAEQAVARARAAGVPVGLATLRIIKPGEDDSLRVLAAARPDAILVRNLAALAFFRGQEPRPTLVGDFSLNAANDLAANLLLSLGLDRLAPGLDVAGGHLEAMLRRVPPGRIEVVLHQHVAMFHTQHCLFAARPLQRAGRLCRGARRPRPQHGGPAHSTEAPPTGLSPCRLHVELRDRKGEAHPVLADAACRNTVYQSAPRSAAADILRLRHLGVRHFRVELLNETADQTTALLGQCCHVGVWPPIPVTT